MFISQDKAKQLQVLLTNNLQEIPTHNTVYTCVYREISTQQTKFCVFTKHNIFVQINMCILNDKTKINHLYGSPEFDCMKVSHI